MRACALNMFGKLVIIAVQSIAEASEKENLVVYDFLLLHNSDFCMHV